MWNRLLVFTVFRCYNETMPEPQVVDAFKFVAVRPPQLVSPRETLLTQMSDARDENAFDGGDRVREFAQGQDVPINEQLETLAHSSRRLADHFAGQPGDVPAVMPLKFQQELAAAGDPVSAAGRAWDALYAAYRRGPDAGPRLETPLAALRALHCASLSQRGAISTAADAVAALTATALVPPQLAIVENPEPSPWRGMAAVVDRTEEGAARLRSLVEEVAATRSLLDAVRSVKLSSKAAVESQESAEVKGQLRREHITLNRRATLATVMRNNLTPTAQAVASKLQIQEQTSVPMATGALQQHLSRLLHDADSLSSDPVVRRDLIRLSSELNVIDLVGALPADYVYKPREDPGTSPDVDVSGRIKPLGIGDLKVVKQTLLEYQPGEVAHIENVLKGENKERVHRTLDRTETTIFESSEESTESERDTQSTERFELKKEADHTIKEDMSIQAGVTVTAAFGPVVTTAHGDFAYSTSKQESQKSSSNFAREVVDRSVTKIQKKVKTERTTKTFHETEETNTHGIDNKDGTGHSVGVYRWVDKKYRAQVYNYGRRLMLEFIVPQPAAFWLASQNRRPPEVDADAPLPFVTAEGKPLTARDITEHNYMIYASRYNAAGVAPPPAEWVYASTSFEQGALDNGKTVSKASKDLVIPDGYTSIYYIARVALVYVVGGPRFTILIGEDGYQLISSSATKQGSETLLGWLPAEGEWDNPQGVLQVGVAGYDVNAYAVTIGVNCKRNQGHYDDWQLKAFEKIGTAYQAMQTAYEQKIAQAQAMGIEIQGRNPAANREIEQSELKKLCVMMMTGWHLGDFDAMTDPPDAPDHHPEVDILEALAEGPVIQFFEQAFDWRQMTYLFYPYFWGRKKNWVKAGNSSEMDPQFKDFVQAGAARVVVPVSPAYNQAIAYFLSKESPHLADRIWLGGEAPTINDPLYRSIAEEVKAKTDDLAGATPEGDPWEFTVPTTLVWLQQGPELPTFPS